MRSVFSERIAISFDLGWMAVTWNLSCPCIVLIAELMANMGGYSTGPVILGGAGAKPNSFTKNRGYSQFAFAYPPSGWGDHCMAGGFYGGYGVPIPMMGRHMAMDPASMDFMAEQFQGTYLTINTQTLIYLVETP